jgi:hypothetical protein
MVLVRNGTTSTETTMSQPAKSKHTSKSESKEQLQPKITIVPVEETTSVNEWTKTMYDLSDITDEMIKNLIEMFSYKGFDREEVMKQIHALVNNDKRLFIELVVSTAMRGPQAASRIKLSVGRTPAELGIPASGGKGTKSLTLNKIQAATADLAAYFLKRMNIPRRLNVECPGWLQFPSAAAIRMPTKLREQHIEFHKKFSEIIGGVFNQQIYSTIEMNSYLDPNLRLFD